MIHVSRLVLRIFFLFLTPHLDKLKLTVVWGKYFLLFFIHFFILCDLFAMKLSYCCCWLSIIITSKRNKQHESKSTKTFKNHCLMKNFAFLESLLAIFKFFASSNFLFSHKLLTGPQPTFLECTLIFLSSNW